MTNDENPADTVIEQAAEVVYKTGIYVNKYAASQIAHALHDAGLLADPADRDEWLTKFREAQAEVGQVRQVCREVGEQWKRAEAEVERQYKVICRLERTVEGYEKYPVDGAEVITKENAELRATIARCAALADEWTNDLKSYPNRAVEVRRDDLRAALMR